MSLVGDPLERQSSGPQSLSRKLILITMTVLGAGYVLTNVSMVIMFQYYFSRLSISSVQNVLEMSGILLYMLASVVFIVMGVLLIVGAIKYYRGFISRGTVALAALLGTFYVNCLGIGSVLLAPQIDFGGILLTLSPVFFMAAIAAHSMQSYRFEFAGSILGLVGAVFFMFAVYPAFGCQIFKLAFVEWNVPFPGPFMSLAIVEGPALVLGSSAVFVHSVLSSHEKRRGVYVFYSIATLAYGIGLFVGPLILSLSFLDLLWKAPWVGPLHNVPSWVLGTVTFWSASLMVLVLGGILLIFSSFVGFFLALRTVEE